MAYINNGGTTMNDGLQKQMITLEDGRKAERIVQAEDSEGKTVTEVWVEPIIERKLSQRVVEYRKPVVHRREVETVDEVSGEVIERKVESLEPENKMQLREFIKTESSVKAMSVEEPCDCYVTKEEMQSTFRDGFLAIAKVMNPTTPDVKVSAMQAIVEDRIASNGNVDITIGVALWTAIAGLVAVLTYVVWF